MKIKAVRPYRDWWLLIGDGALARKTRTHNRLPVSSNESENVIGEGKMREEICACNGIGSIICANDLTKWNGVCTVKSALNTSRDLHGTWVGI
jgi:hypothetical protein